MNFLSQLLKVDGIATWNDVVIKAGADWGWATTLISVMSTVLWIALALVGAAGAIYALYVGIKMARADSAEQRDENKKRLINIIVSIVVVIALILFFNTLLPMILNAFGVFDPKTTTESAVRLLLHA